MIRDLVFSIIIGCFFGFTSMQSFRTPVNVFAGVISALTCFGLLSLLNYIQGGPTFSR